MKESQIQAQIVGYLEQTGWVVIETSQKGFDWGTKGSPDVIATKRHTWHDMNNPDKRTRMEFNGNRTLWIECKGPRGKQSDDQIEMQRKLESVDAEYLLANSLDIVMDHLK